MNSHESIIFTNHFHMEKRTYLYNFQIISSCATTNDFGLL